MLDGKIVATNRSKATEQKTYSLQEFRDTNGDTVISKLTIKPHPPQYKDMNRIMSGAVLGFDRKVGVMQSSIVGSFYKSTNGNKSTPRKYKLLAQNASIVFVPN